MTQITATLTEQKMTSESLYRELEAKHTVNGREVLTAKEISILWDSEFHRHEFYLVDNDKVKLTGVSKQFWHYNSGHIGFKESDMDAKFKVVAIH